MLASSSTNEHSAYPAFEPTKLDRLLRLKDVESLVNLKKTTIYKLIRLGKFPNYTKIVGSSRWSERKIMEWIADQVDQTQH